jgi:hypothetical protein
MWTFDVQKARNAAGNEIPVDVDAFSEGFSSHPLAFDTEIRARGDYVKDIVFAANDANHAASAEGQPV